MYEVISYLRFFEMLKEDESPELVESLRWTVVSRCARVPFAPTPGISFRWDGEPDYDIEEVVWSIEHMAFITFGAVPLDREDYEEVIQNVLEGDGWEHVEDESNECESCGKCGGCKDGGDNEGNPMLN